MIAHRYLNLNAYLRNSGYHSAAWRVSSADPASVPDPRCYTGLPRPARSPAALKGTHSGRSAANPARGLR